MFCSHVGDNQARGQPNVPFGTLGNSNAVACSDRTSSGLQDDALVFHNQDIRIAAALRQVAGFLVLLKPRMPRPFWHTLLALHHVIRFFRRLQTFLEIINMVFSAHAEIQFRNGA